MVKTKIIVTSLVAILSFTAMIVWLLMSHRPDSQSTREKFFGPSQQYPTSGGEKMKIEW